MAQDREGDMESFQDQLLAVWREVCRHLDIRESASNLTRLLASELPIANILVRRFEPTERNLETVAIGRVNSSTKEFEPLTHFSTGWSRIQAWGKSTELEHSSGVPRDGIAAHVVPQDLTGEVLIGPLRVAERPSGALLLQAKAGERFQNRHRRMLAALLEPFSLALENDRRLHDLATLRRSC